MIKQTPRASAFTCVCTIRDKEDPLAGDSSKGKDTYIAFDLDAESSEGSMQICVFLFAL